MAAAPLSIKLRCASWQQLSTIYKRDLARSAMFLKSGNPPALGTLVRIDLTLPSESMIVLNGVVSEHVGAGGMNGRGPGVDIKLATIPQSAMWLIETALAAQKDARGTPPTAAAAPVSEASAEEGRDVSEAEDELVEALGAELESLTKLNPFQVLGVGYEVGDAEVRAAFGELTKRYHPDRYARYPSTELRRLAAEIFIVIRDAYRKLGDETTRAQTAAQLGRGAAPRAVPMARPTQARAATPPPVARPATPPPRPGTPLPVAFGTDEAPRAVPIARPAPVARPAPPPPRPGTPPPVRSSVPPADTQRAPVLVAPPPRISDDGTALDLAGIEALLDEGKFDAAVQAFRLYAKTHPGDRGARAGIDLAEGMKAMANRDRLEAAQRFEAVLEMDPSNERAARELAEMRRQATNERKGLLTKLLGKKE